MKFHSCVSIHLLNIKRGLRAEAFFILNSHGIHEGALLILISWFTVGLNKNYTSGFTQIKCYFGREAADCYTVTMGEKSLFDKAVQ